MTHFGWRRLLVVAALPLAAALALTAAARSHHGAFTATKVISKTGNQPMS